VGKKGKEVTSKRQDIAGSRRKEKSILKKKIGEKKNSARLSKREKQNDQEATIKKFLQEGDTKDILRKQGKEK